jgi:chemosensory pili system protein ChpA (sensor histidine kinase/response regulator)
MSGQRQQNTLLWIKSELDETIRQARLALEDYVEGSGEGASMEECARLLHQIYGTLRMVRLYGVAMLAEEMELAARAMLEDRVRHRIDAAEILMRALIQLPDYLEKLQAGYPDMPLIVLPLMNDLRAARDADLLSEVTLFAPGLEQRLAALAGTGTGSEALREKAQRLRHSYHKALLSWYRDAGSETGLEQLCKILAKLTAKAGSEAVRSLFQITEAVVAALKAQAIEPGIAVKLLLGKLDRQIKLIIDEGEDAVSKAPPLELQKNLLYYVAQADTDADQVRMVRNAFGLKGVLPSATELEASRGSMAAPNRELMGALSEAIHEDLLKIKDALDLFIRRGAGGIEGLAALEVPLRKAADTLGMVGQGALRERMKSRADRIQEVVAGGEVPTEAELEDIARDILYVEAAVGNLATTGMGVYAGGDAAGHEAEPATGEYAQLVSAVIHEAAIDMARVKEAIVDFLKAPAKSDVLAEVPQHFSAIAGAFTLLQLNEVAQLLKTIGGYVEARLLSGGAVPAQDQVNALADAITSVEFFMERVAAGQGVQDEILDVAREAMARLGMVEESEVPEAVPVAAEPEPVLDLAHDEEIKIAPEELEAPAEELPQEPEASHLDDLDSEIIEIFVEEAREELAVIQEYLPHWCQHPEDHDALTTVRRSFHTLKGSGRLVGAQAIGEFAWSIENLLNRVMEETIPVTAQVLGLLGEAADMLPGLVESHEQGQATIGDVQPLMDRAFALVDGGGAIPGDELAPEEAEAEPEAELVAELEPPIRLEPTLLEIFGAESRGHIETIKGFLEACYEVGGARRPEDSISRAFHTLHGSAHMAEVEPIARLSSALEDLTDELIAQERGADEAVQALFAEGIETIGVVLKAINQPGAQLPDWPALEQRVNQQCAGLKAEGEAVAEEAPAVLGGAEPEPEILDAAELEVLEELDQAEPQTDLPQLEEAEEGASQEPVVSEPQMPLPPADVEEPEEALELTLADELEEVELGQEPAASEPQVPLPPADVVEPEEELELEITEDLEIDGLDLLDEAEVSLEEPLEVSTEVAPEIVAEEAAGVEEAEIDEELVEIFMEEARELLDGLENSLQEWIQVPADLGPLAELQRILHTLKGGARLAGIMPLGDLSHAFESLLTGVDNGKVSASPELLTLTQAVADRLMGQIEEVEGTMRATPATDLMVTMEAFLSGAPVEEAVSEPPETALEVEAQAAPPEVEEVPAFEEPVEPTAPTVEEEPTVEIEAEAEVPPVPAPTEKPEAGDLHTSLEGDAGMRPTVKPKQEQVRVQSELLDRLVNNAGEVSIYRARMEQQNGTLSFSLSELEQTVVRLREQLRKLDMETEAQMLFRYEREKDEVEVDRDFDPLEMDRFSTMQQLSRALTETVNDLVSIKDLMEDLSRENETLLIQQSRVATDLQDGLLRTRMVPFSQLVPRLHRVVRQTCTPLGKQASLDVHGAEGELDRSILDRMIAPLEHILRNALSHGIEMPEERVAPGKAEAGHISLTLEREGTELLIIIEDDGAGINLEAIRKRAIDKEMLAEDAEISDQDLIRFILEPGFSTAQQVTQISGRGVGMDVVFNEIKQLGGALEIDSKVGKGSKFVVRLPLTLAITDAILVQVDEDVYAIPHTSIEGVVRVSREELQGYYDGHLEGFAYAGRSYMVRYLDAMLGGAVPQVVEQKKWFPLLLVRSGGHRVALQVDGLLGNRQVVVKSVGRQLSAVRWITGGTILGDGSVALILDVSALVRTVFMQPLAPVAEAEEPVSELIHEPPAALAPAAPTVMVVDDSITVRKVTTRLLERNNMQVLTAKDGVDAVAVLQDHLPDIMLLDVEMPRMDGYELARHMRSTERLRDVPIIMITSRTGDKHRKVAMELGVKRYLGKPYQEQDLLSNIEALLAEKTT